MIGYLTVGTNDLAKSTAYYDVLLAELGAKRSMDMETFVAWSNGGETDFTVIKPFDGETATPGNGAMVAIAVDSTSTVDKLHAKALELGGTDEGAPGPRGGEDSPFYAGYFRDLDGNKLNFFHFKQP